MRFELEYVARDGSRQRPVMIHRALLGSIERFMAVLIEQHAGAFPLWLAPIQARILTVSEKASAYAEEVTALLRSNGLRAEADLGADKLGAKVRRAQVDKIPYMLVVGEKDMAARVVSPRTREGQQHPPAPVEEFARRLAEEARPPVPGDTSPAPALATAGPGA
jgi:threonyl-tRNA synthetase